MKRLGWIIAAGIVLFVAIQLIPYGHNRVNPPVTQNAPWTTPAAEAVARRACYDCHSNEVAYPWYAAVAPASWLIQRDVEEARQKLNFSEWDRGQEADEIAEVLREGEMPPTKYVLLHPAARLSDADIQTLLAGLPAGSEGGGD
jgi:cytochrome c551/c552